MKGIRKGLRIRAKRKKLPVLLVPISRGPLQNFFHFLFGYFVPLYWYLMNNPGASVAAVRYPPYGDWFDLLPGNPPKFIDALKAMKHSFLSRESGFSPDYRVEGLLGWDKWERFPDRPLRSIAAHLRESVSEKTTFKADDERAEIIVVLRNHEPEFLADNPTLIYGSKKRNIPNLEELVAALEARYSIRAVDPGSLPPTEVISLFSQATLVVGQHGAGLSNCFFLAPGSKVLEICWPDFQESDYSRIFGLMTESLGLRYLQLPLQVDPFSSVNIKSLVGIVSEEMD